MLVEFPQEGGRGATLTGADNVPRYFVTSFVLTWSHRAGSVRTHSNTVRDAAEAHSCEVLCPSGPGVQRGHWNAALEDTMVFITLRTSQYPLWLFIFSRETGSH